MKIISQYQRKNLIEGTCEDICFLIEGQEYFLDSYFDNIKDIKDSHYYMKNLLFQSRNHHFEYLTNKKYQRVYQYLIMSLIYENNQEM